MSDKMELVLITTLYECVENPKQKYAPSSFLSKEETTGELQSAVTPWLIFGKKAGKRSKSPAPVFSGKFLQQFQSDCTS